MYRLSILCNVSSGNNLSVNNNLYINVNDLNNRNNREDSMRRRNESIVS